MLPPAAYGWMTGQGYGWLIHKLLPKLWTLNDTCIRNCSVVSHAVRMWWWSQGTWGTVLLQPWGQPGASSPTAAAAEGHRQAQAFQLLGRRVRYATRSIYFLKFCLLCLYYFIYTNIYSRIYVLLIIIFINKSNNAD